MAQIASASTVVGGRSAIQPGDAWRNAALTQPGQQHGADAPCHSTTAIGLTMLGQQVSAQGIVIVFDQNVLPAVAALCDVVANPGL